MLRMSWLDWFRPRPKPPPPAPTGLGAELLAAVNDARGKAGLPPLAPDARLGSAAAAHARDMAMTGVLSHQGFPQRLTDAGYAYSAAAENVAAGQASVEAVVDGWMASPPHRANMFGAYADGGGAGACDAQGRWWWCLDLANPQ
jgi:uncharacterized protein YkwD